MINTKQRILETAERSFAENGYSGTSLRSIIGEAGVNLAAVHYHFGSKEELLKAVIMRRADPVNVERLALLDACERDAAGGPPELERVLEAFVAPTLRVARQPGGDQFVRLMGRIYTERLDMLAQIIKTQMNVMLERFHAALRRALPDLPHDELLWRAYFAMGSVAHALRGFGHAVVLPGVTDDIDATLARLIPFISAGFRAPRRKP